VHLPIISEFIEMTVEGPEFIILIGGLIGFATCTLDFYDLLLVSWKLESGGVPTLDIALYVTFL